jgi:hypothetical protein
MFKVKNKKIFVADQRVTLDTRHNDFIKKFKVEENRLPDIDKELKSIKITLEEYSKIGYENLSDEQLWENLTKKNRYDELINLKNNIKNNTEINDYFLKTGNILFNYFDDIESTACDVKPKKKIQNTQPKNIPIKNNILNFFQNLDNNETNHTDTHHTDSNHTDTNHTDTNHTDTNHTDTNHTDTNHTDTNHTDTHQTKSNHHDINDNREPNNSNVETSKKLTNNRAELLNKYLSLVDNTYCNFDKISTEKTIDFCAVCLKNHGKKIEKVLIPNEGISVCDRCGDLTHIVIDSDKPSYKDPPPEATYFAYKKINHLNEWLNQIQALESTDIPEEIYERIWEEIKKERIDDLSKLNYKKIRDYLKKLRLNKYYEHIPHILFKLNGLPAPKLTNEVVEVLRAMFREIQGPFNEICPPDRKNFLSYSYTLHKFVELLGLDEYKLLFPLLKSREKLHQQDIMWKKICEKVGWEFIKSI